MGNSALVSSNQSQTLESPLISFSPQTPKRPSHQVHRDSPSRSADSMHCNIDPSSLQAIYPLKTDHHARYSSARTRPPSDPNP